MPDLAIGGISVVVLLGIVYWCQRTFVSEKTCKARQDCIEAKIDGLSTLVKANFRHIEKLIGDLIKRHE